jgi:hypothetical protein
VSPLARRGARRFIAAAVLTFTLAAGLIAGPVAVTTAGATAATHATQPDAALLPDDALRVPVTVGVQPARVPTVGRAAGIARVPSVMPAVAALAAGLRCPGTTLRSSFGADHEVLAGGRLSWAGPGGRRAPPPAPAA